MNITSRLKNIELKIPRKNEKQEIIILTEDNGKYFMEKDGQQIEVEKPDYDSNKLVIVKSYLNYEMQKDIR